MPKRKQPERKPFFKVFSREWLEGSLRFECTDAERGIFADLMALANESRQRGIIQANPTTPYPHTWIAAKLNTTLEFLEQCLQKFEVQERINEDAQGIHLINFDYYQKELYAKRGRPPKYQREESKGTPTINTKNIYSIYEQNIGLITPMVAEELKLIAQEYSEEWFSEATKEAVQANARNLKYIEAILVRWKRDGFKASKKSKQQGEKLPPEIIARLKEDGVEI